MSQLALVPLRPEPAARSEQEPAKPRLVAIEGGREMAAPAARAALAPIALPSHGPTLEAVLSTAFAAVSAGAPAACPVCDDLMEPRWSAGFGAVGGRCTDCGTTLE